MSMFLKGKYKKPVIICGPGKTKQSFANETNINTIVARYQKTGMISRVEDNPGIFADVSKIEDYQGMVSKIRFAQESFEQLPPALRKRFGNDPGRLVEFVSDSENIEEAIKLGILPKPIEAAKKALKAAPVDPVVAVKPLAEEPKVPSKKA